MVEKRSLFGDAVVRDDYVRLNIINCSDYVAEDIEGIIGKVLKDSSIQADKRSWTEPDEYVITWGTQAWRGDIASIFAEGGNLKISVTFSIFLSIFKQNL